MKMLSWVMNTKAGELKIALLLCFCAFFKGASILYLETVSNVLFISSLNVEHLPYIYLFVALFTAVIGLLYSYCEKKLSAIFLIIGIHIVLAIITFIFYLSIGHVDKKILSFLIMVWKDVYYIFIEITFWATAGFLFTLEQSKRIFGLLIASEVLADIIGGFTMPQMIQLLTIDQLILLSFSAFFISTLFLIYIIFSLNINIEESHPPPPLPIQQYWSNKYLRMLMIFSITSIFSYYFMDYIFYEEVSAKFTDEKETASFFGMYFGTLGIINFLISLFLSGKLLIHWGIGFGMLTPPLILIFGTFFVSLSSFYSSIAGLFFGAIILLKITYDIAIYTIETPTRKVLYIPIRLGHRLQVQGALESIVEPIAAGLIALILIILTSYFSLTSKHLLLLLFINVIAWFIVGLYLHKEYGNLLMRKI